MPLAAMSELWRGGLSGRSHAVCGGGGRINKRDGWLVYSVHIAHKELIKRQRCCCLVGFGVAWKQARKKASSEVGQY